ncbi:low molecular weight phosphatase family protein [Aeromicrobium sp. SMF47]|uniref:protein-tyrosine-phosphatase n=1 Tax=Aeromicrobium yanjiei TaxID=2662028 RepID=A0A5Q2MBA3_9ACTN|nr:MULTISPECIES: low molecular weight phosphatase family protein [Aeromicrobium]MRJ75178.1 low molecular weight phosphatase family protein [Aeromicrobium yanjiei]MRK02764.1 low molecular weight phosphatase family protein [Aeromicrobium sp. S22]QGG40367.1 low molecular weight phosphatase family protein [Aeromicrobium yanjiei]
MSAPRFGILAVCTANICRSPMMEMLLQAQLDDSRYEVASAGVQGWDRKPMDASAAAELERLGHSAEGFRSHPIGSYLVDSADLILTATRTHRSDVLGLSPQALRRSFTLVEFAALSGIVTADSPRELVAQAAQQRSLAPAEIDIGDPYRRGPEVHRAIADQIAEAVATISTRLNALVTADSH